MASDSAEKMRRYRRRLRERGLRPVQVWLPDLNDPEQLERLRADARKLRGHPSEAEIEGFLDNALAEIDGWE